MKFPDFCHRCGVPIQPDLSGFMNTYGQISTTKVLEMRDGVDQGAGGRK